jgi:hypothetical protein
VFGIVLTQFFVYWPASVQDQSIIMQDGRRELGITKVRSPEYIRQFAHPLSSAFTSEMTFATQWTEFNYLGPKDELSDWDPTDPDQIPISVGITRFHFGWPFRAMYFDLIGISTEGRWDHMRSYFDSVNAAAGLNVGIETPDWWPAVRKNDRLPIRPHLGGLLLNTGIFASVWIIIALLIRWMITERRRKRGHCVECAYQIEDLQVCPQCATTRS